MRVYVVGVNYKTTPIEIREKFSIEPDEYERMLSGIKKDEGISECAILSTCNRTEIHIFSEASSLDTAIIEKIFCQLKGLDIYKMKKYFYVYEGVNAVRHIIKVAAGMDSMILGEDQILGQFRKAYDISIKYGTSQAVLNTLARLAVTSSKKIKTRSLAIKKVSSVAGQVGQLLEEQYGSNLAGKNVLVIGSGEIGKAVSKMLLETGIKNILITKRDIVIQEKSQDNTVFETIDYNDRYSYIEQADIIIGATSSPHYTITSDILSESIKDKEKKHLFIDLAVPRDFDEAIERLDNVNLYNIDQLKNIESSCSDTEKLFDFDYINEQINCHIHEFIRWYNYRNTFMKAQNLGC